MSSSQISAFNMMEVAAVGAAASLSLADVNYDNVGKKDGSQCTFMGLLTLLLVGTSLTFCVLEIAIEGSSIVIVSAVITFLVTPIVLLQRYQLSRMSTLREVHNALRQKVNRLTIENSDLEHQTTRLSEKAELVRNAEGQLQTIVSTQGSSVSSFVELIREQSAVLKEISQLLVAEVAQELMTTIVRVDRDQNFILTEMEITELLIRIQNLKGVENIDEAQLRDVLARSNGIEGIFNVIKTMQNNKKTSLIQVSPRNVTL